MRHLALLCVVGTLLCPVGKVARAQVEDCPAAAQCWSCQVVQHVDGDTFKARCQLESGAALELSEWMDEMVSPPRPSIRLFAIDAPETAVRAKCDEERLAGQRAAAFLEQRMPIGSRIRVLKIGEDKYNRWIAMVRFGLVDIGSELVWKGYARPWQWQAPKPSWCQEAARR